MNHFYVQRSLKRTVSREGREEKLNCYIWLYGYHTNSDWRKVNGFTEQISPGQKRSVVKKWSNSAHTHVNDLKCERLLLRYPSIQDFADRSNWAAASVSHRSAAVRLSFWCDVDICPCAEPALALFRCSWIFCAITLLWLSQRVPIDTIRVWTLHF